MLDTTMKALEIEADTQSYVAYVESPLEKALLGIIYSDDWFASI